MRYYRLSLLKDGQSVPVNINGIKTTLGPFDTSKTPGYGQHIEFDILIQGWDTVTSGCLISIFGLPIEMLNQSLNLEDYQVTLEAGFQEGLPLANPKQNGIILQGKVYSAYANWLGTNQCLVLNCQTQQFDQVLSSFPIKPITLVGKKPDKLADIIENALRNAYPDYEIEINISNELILTEKVEGIYSRGLRQFAIMMRSFSKGLNQKAGYDGVRMTIAENKIKIWDNDYISHTSKSIEINFEEIIGQPTWLAVNTITFKCPIRADINIDDYVLLKQDPYSNKGRVFFGSSSQIFNYARNKLNFSGQFQIISIRHVGQYLNPDANNAWVTIYEANLIPNTT